MNVWVLIDDRPGHATQARGVAQQLGMGFEEKKLRFSWKACLPNVLLGASLKGIDIAKSDELMEPWPDLVIAAGRRTAPVARYIKKQNPNSFLAQLMWPEAGSKEFGLIAVPAHDEKKPAANIVETLGPPHVLTEAKLREAPDEWKETLEYFPKPHIVVLAGGDSKHGNFTSAAARKLGEQASDMARARGGSLFVSTSRRTPLRIQNALYDGLSVPSYFHKWNPGGANPYFAFLGMADYLVVTGDSISMCAEACFTGKPVGIFTGDERLSRKHGLFHQALYERGLAHPFTGEWQEAAYAPLDVAGEIAAQIRKRAGI